MEYRNSLQLVTLYCLGHAWWYLSMSGRDLKSEVEDADGTGACVLAVDEQPASANAPKATSTMSDRFTSAGYRSYSANLRT